MEQNSCAHGAIFARTEPPHPPLDARRARSARREEWAMIFAAGSVKRDIFVCLGEINDI